MFSSRSFIISGLRFRSLIHFQFIFVYGVRKCSSFILLQMVDEFSQHHLLKGLTFLYCIFLPPLPKIRCPQVCGSISELSVLLHLSIFLPLCQYHTVLMTVALQQSLKSGRLIPPVPFFFLKVPLAIRGFLYLHTCPIWTWKHHRCPLADKWIRKLWYINTMEYYSAIRKNAFESVLMRWMKLEPMIQSEVSQKEKHQYGFLMHVYGIQKDDKDDPICETAKETQI